MDDVQLLKENTSNECEDSRVKRNAAKQIQTLLGGRPSEQRFWVAKGVFGLA